MTPREGKAVEIQALWYNSLKTMELLAAKFGDNDYSQECKSRAETTKENFLKKFWNPRKDCLFDVLLGENRDDSIRPNQIFAVALDFAMLNPELQSSIINVVQDNLWAEYGLRTLSPDHPHYKGKYVGDWNARNYAYHNGTTWSWLVGSFVTSFLKVKEDNSEARKFAFQNFLNPLFSKQTFQAGLGTVSEIFDGDSPHLPRGSISQAWSVAETLRAYVEDILCYVPPFEKAVLGEGSNG